MYQIRIILADLYTSLEEYLGEEIENEYQKGSEQALKDLNSIGSEDKSFALIDRKPIEFLFGTSEDILQGTLADAQAVLSNTYTHINRTLNLVHSEVQRELLAEVAEGQILGKARTKISEKLVSRLEREGLTAMIYTDKNGKDRRLSLEAYAEAIARSALIQSRAAGVITRALESGYDLLKISNHREESIMCRGWGDKIVSITGQTKGYPTLAEALFDGTYNENSGIFHRYCRHSLRVYIQTDVEFDLS